MNPFVDPVDRPLTLADLRQLVADSADRPGQSIVAMRTPLATDRRAVKVEVTEAIADQIGSAPTQQEAK